MVNKCPIRSISLPSRSHPSTIRIEEELRKFKSWETTSTSTSDSICTGLTLLEDLYVGLDDILNMASTQHVINHHKGEKCVEEVLDGSLRILDICGITRDTMLQIKENVQALHSTLRRRKGDSSIEKSVGEYNFFTKKMKKNVNKLVSSLKQMDNKFGESLLLDFDQHFSCVIRVLREVISMNLFLFQVIFSFLTMSSSKSKPTKWFMVAKLMHKGGIACEDNSQNINEMQCVEEVLSTLLNEGNNGEKMKATHERLKDLENAIEGIENALESIFRCLIKSRSSLLNIISQ
ncbi:hypothetical protein TanjilG_04789 [Lupinus angustifolius]|uniref:DUF241 domain-containing protein n=1 Tax=Lupinus angustifolius TaxID=3871 RepID=A0A4P1QS87_LUPAN|nr:PREDICTED: uncharacterized protein LOC109332708 [Lupinus angustifolius]OIV93557.1 hypothetical protein TanjilG_04789 [Lupinus angustifolius]